MRYCASMGWRLFLKRSEAINKAELLAKDPAKGLPEDVFLFVSRLTPMLNVDLLIQDKKGKTLLTWRNDGYGKPGWHIPGGIVRYKEDITTRIRKTALAELGTGVDFACSPLAVTEFIHTSRKDRGHFVSLLYKCRLTGTPDNMRMYRAGRPKPGEWAWHSGCPENLLSFHKVYRRYLQSKGKQNDRPKQAA